MEMPRSVSMRRSWLWAQRVSTMWSASSTPSGVCTAQRCSEASGPGPILSSNTADVSLRMSSWWLDA